MKHKINIQLTSNEVIDIVLKHFKRKKENTMIGVNLEWIGNHKKQPYEKYPIHNIWSGLELHFFK